MLIDTLAFSINVEKHWELVEWLKSSPSGFIKSEKRVDTQESVTKESHYDFNRHRNHKWVLMTKLHVASWCYDINYRIAEDSDKSGKKLFMEFSIPKYLYGHNVRQWLPEPGHKDFNLSKYEIVKNCAELTWEKIIEFIQIFIADNFPVQMAKKISLYDIEIEHIDICWEQIFQNKEDCWEYLRAQKSVKKKYIREVAKNQIDYFTSVFFHTAEHSFKIYHKGSEFEKNDYKRLTKLNVNKKNIIARNPDERKFEKQDWERLNAKLGNKNLAHVKEFEEQKLNKFIHIQEQRKIDPLLEKWRELSHRTLRYEMRFKNKLISRVFNEKIFRSEKNDWLVRVALWKKCNSMLKGNVEVKISETEKKIVQMSWTYMPKIFYAYAVESGFEINEVKPEKLIDAVPFAVFRISEYKTIFREVSGVFSKQRKFVCKQTIETREFNNLWFPIEMHNNIVKIDNRALFSYELVNELHKIFWSNCMQFQVESKTKLSNFMQAVVGYNKKMKLLKEKLYDKKLLKKYKSINFSTIKNVVMLLEMWDFDWRRLVQEGVKSKSQMYALKKTFKQLGFEGNYSAEYKINAPKDNIAYYEFLLKNGIGFEIPK